MSWYSDELVNDAYKFDLPIHKPFYQLSDEQKEPVWLGNEYFQGLNDFFKELEEKNYKIQNRVMLSRYRGKPNATPVKENAFALKLHTLRLKAKQFPIWLIYQLEI